jgi:hypothetical protein
MEFNDTVLTGNTNIGNGAPWHVSDKDFHVIAVWQLRQEMAKLFLCFNHSARRHEVEV